MAMFQKGDRIVVIHKFTEDRLLFPVGATGTFIHYEDEDHSARLGIEWDEQYRTGPMHNLSDHIEKCHGWYVSLLDEDGNTCIAHDIGEEIEFDPTVLNSIL